MTEICENNKMHYFNREMDFRKTEWPSLPGGERPAGGAGVRNFETDAAAVAVPDVTSLTAQLPCPSQCQRSELLRSARPGQLGPSRHQQRPRSDDSEPLSMPILFSMCLSFRVLVATSRQ